MKEMRDAIDRIDEEIMALLARRFRLSRQIIRMKRQRGEAVFDPEREQEILCRAASWGEEVRRCYHDLLTLSKEDGVRHEHDSDHH